MSTARLLQGAAVILGFALLAAVLSLSRKSEEPASPPPKRTVAERRPMPADQQRARPLGQMIRPNPGKARLAHSEAEQILHAAGIKLLSSGACGDRTRSECTSLEGIRRPAIEGILMFKQRSGCPVVITGGTEVGHADGRYSHARGYKLDITPDECVTGYIKRTGRYAGTRGDGAAIYEASNGVVYNRESDHWDITFR